MVENVMGPIVLLYACTNISFLYSTLGYSDAIYLETKKLFVEKARKNGRKIVNNVRAQQKQ